MRPLASVLAALSLASAALGQSSSARPSESGGNSQSHAASGTQAPASGSGGTTPAPTPSAFVSTSFSQGISFIGPNRSQTTVSVAIPITIQPTAAPATTGGNATQPNGSEIVTTSSTPTTFPYAPTTVDAGAQGGPNAPSPGAGGKSNGPDDSYIAGARQLAVGGVTLALGLGAALVFQQLA
ncbi:hypothetical protein RhiJN_04200 [Ceratobasidium sp. AG-Ba]|nr:hypothetical protein RhiJN_04200 [Ceratobasidium sp. AG-Ba]